MATSKTLTPTNVTIQIPAFTDAPDQRVNSNCIDKEADAINALNSNIANLNTDSLVPSTVNATSPLIKNGNLLIVQANNGQTTVREQFDTGNKTITYWNSADGGASWTQAYHYLHTESYKQNGTSHTITFSGQAECRRLFGFICVAGQAGITNFIPFSFSGSSIAVTNIVDVYVADNDYGITASGLTISIPAGIGNNWGSVELILLRGTSLLTITYD